MAQIDGKLVICDRCGERAFTKLKKTVTCGTNETIIEYEDLPKGWYLHYYFGDLCPKCAKEYEETQKKFFAKGEKTNG